MRLWIFLLLVAASVPSWAARVATVSPQGEVAEVRQISVRFDQAVVPAGDPRLPSPFTLECNGAATLGDAHRDAIAPRVDFAG